MTSKGTENLLWELAGNDGKGGSPADGGRTPEEEGLLSDERLESYRSGKLDEAEARRVEEALSISPTGRQRLAELAEVQLEAPPETVRRHVLEAAPRGAAATPRQSQRRWWLGAAAAALAMALLIPTLLDRSLPEELIFDVTAAGRPPARSMTLSEEGIPSLATTRVTIVVEPRGAGQSGLEFGLYRLEGPHLRRLDLDPEVRRETGRGTAQFSALARDLAGSVPGDYEVFVAVAREGDLPEELSVSREEEAAEKLAAEGRRRVYRKVVHLLADER